MPQASSKHSEIISTLERVLPSVVRPARYCGNEWNSVVKDWPGRLSVVLVYPDVYEECICDPLAQSYYALLNGADSIVCERAYLPWPDMDQTMRQTGLPLFALESKRELAAFDIVLIILPDELHYPAVLTLLDLAGLPIRASERRGQRHETRPLVVGAGPAIANPEPLAAFFDAFIIGEVDAQALLETAAAMRSPRQTPPAWLYPPHSDARTGRQTARRTENPPPLVSRPIVPFVEAKRERAVIELSAPPLYPWTGACPRQRPADEILSGVEALLKATGYDHVQLTGQHSELRDIVDRLSTRYSAAHIHFALDAPVTTPDTVDLADRLPHIGRGVLSIDLAASSESDILAAARLAFQRGWHVVRANVSLGLPGETWQDMERTAGIARSLRDIGRAEIGGQVQVHVHASPYIPRAHSPLQRAALLVDEEWDRRVQFINNSIRGPALRLHWHGLDTRLAQAALARGDRTLAAVIEAAWRVGMRCPENAGDAVAWQAAFAAAGVDMLAHAARERPPDEGLPWEHISVI